jgi:hypothetical protein
MLGCVTRGSRNIAFAMNTDDYVIWFTEVWFTEVKTLGSHNLSLGIQPEPAPGRYQSQDLFIKVLWILCPNLTDAFLLGDLITVGDRTAALR